MMLSAKSFGAGVEYKVLVYTTDDETPYIYTFIGEIDLDVDNYIKNMISTSNMFGWTRPQIGVSNTIDTALLSKILTVYSEHDKILEARINAQYKKRARLVKALKTTKTAYANLDARHIRSLGDAKTRYNDLRQKYDRLKRIHIRHYDARRAAPDTPRAVRRDMPRDVRRDTPRDSRRVIYNH